MTLLSIDSRKTETLTSHPTTRDRHSVNGNLRESFKLHGHWDTWTGICIPSKREVKHMWLNRVLFNIKTRLLNQKTDEGTPSRPPSPWAADDADKRARLIQYRLIDLDKRLAQIQSR
jgi:hypothetical protein